MAKEIKEEQKKEQKIVDSIESENLQKKGWTVIAIKVIDGQKIHTLEKL